MDRKKLIDEQRTLRLGEKRKMNCGRMAEVVTYRNAQDIDVAIEGRGILTNTHGQARGVV